MQGSGPRLKNGVDLQLQSAFYDQNWSTVVRLAEKRAKMVNDPYYEVRTSADVKDSVYLVESKGIIL